MAKNGNLKKSPKHTAQSIPKKTAKKQVTKEHATQDAIAQNLHNTNNKPYCNIMPKDNK